MNFDNHKFRCSSLGHIMAGRIGLTENQEAQYKELSAKNKTEKGLTERQKLILSDLEEKKNNKELSDGVKTHLKDVYISVKYNRSTDITTRYMEKGLLNEEDSLDLLSKYEDRLLIKNKEFYDDNPYIKGTPDNVQHGRVVDTKTSWDIFTFHRSKITPMYEWQLRGYMMLTGMEEALLVYCLTDTPPHLIYDECRRAAYRGGVIDWENDEEFQKVCEEIERNLTYPDIPVEERVKMFKIMRDKKKEEEIIERVNICREWLNNYSL